MKFILIYTILLLSFLYQETALSSEQLYPDIVKENVKLNDMRELYEEQVVYLSSEKEKLKLSSSILDQLFLSSINEGDIVDMSGSLNIIQGSELQSLSSNYLYKTGDILILKYKPEYREKWSFIVDDWQHAVIIDKRGRFINAGGPNEVIQSLSWDQFKNRYKSYQIEKAVLIQFSLIPYNADRIDQFLQDQIGKPYVPIRQIFTSKYSTDMYYCSSLAWRAYMDSVYYDLDPNSNDTVWPSELALSRYVTKVTAFVW